MTTAKKGKRKMYISVLPGEQVEVAPVNLVIIIEKKKVSIFFFSATFY